MGLCSEEEKALKELVDAYQSGQDINEFINHRLYAELSVDEIDAKGVSYCKAEDGFVEQEQVYKSLADKGYLEADRFRPDNYTYFGLTPEGRTYFEDKEREIKRARDEKWSDRRFTIIWGLITMLVSVTLSIVSSRLLSLSAQPSTDLAQEKVGQENTSLITSNEV